MCQTSSAWHVFPFILLIITLNQTKFSSEQTDNKETVITSTFKKKMFQSKQPKKTAGKQTLPFLSRCLHLLTSAPPIEKKRKNFRWHHRCPGWLDYSSQAALRGQPLSLAAPDSRNQSAWPSTAQHSSAFLSFRRHRCCCCLVVSTSADEREDTSLPASFAPGGRFPVRLHSPSLAPAPLASAPCQSTRLRLPLLFLLLPLLLLLQLLPPPLLLTQPRVEQQQQQLRKHLAAAAAAQRRRRCRC